MQASKKKVGENRVRISVSITAEETDSHMQRGSVAFAQLNGIMPERGKMPYDIVTAKAGKEEVDKFLTTFVMEYLTPFAFTDRKVLTVGAPSYVPDVKLEMGKPFSFRIFAVPCPEYSLESYDPVEISIQPFSISESEFGNYLDELIRVMKSGKDDSYDGGDVSITQEWLKDNYPEFDSVDAFTDAMREQFTKVKEEEYRHYKNFMAASELAKRFKDRIPDEVYEAVRAEQQQGFEMQLAQNGSTKEQFFKERGIDEQQFTMMQMVQAREQLIQQFSLDALARHENLKLTKDDIDSFFAEMSPGHEDDMRRRFEGSGSMYVIEQSALRLKANDWLVQHASIHVLDESDSSLEADDEGN